MVLTLAIAAVLVQATVVCFGIMLDTETNLTNERIVRSEATIALDFITKNIRNADAILAPLPASTAQSLVLTSPLGTTTIIAFHDERLWLMLSGEEEIPMTSEHVVVTDFLVQNLTEGAVPGTLAVTLSLASVQAEQTAHTRIATITLRTGATMRSEIAP